MLRLFNPWTHGFFTIIGRPICENGSNWEYGIDFGDIGLVDIFRSPTEGDNQDCR